ETGGGGRGGPFSLYSVNSPDRAKRLPPLCYHGQATGHEMGQETGQETAWEAASGFRHVSLRAGGGRSVCLGLGGALFCRRCETENGDVQIRRGRPETAGRSARCLSQEVHGEPQRSARPGVGRGCRTKTMKHDLEK